MKWGSFGSVHFATLVFAALLLALTYLLLKNRSRKIQLTVLGIMSFMGNAATVYNLVVWNAPLEYLPLHLCALNGLVLPIAATCLFVLILLVWGKEMFYKSALAVWFMGLYYAIRPGQIFIVGTLTHWLLCIAILSFCMHFVLY